MVDVKKLITGFLIVGSAAAGSGLILATNGGLFGGGAPAAAQNITVTGAGGTGGANTGSGILPGTPLANGGSAFAPQYAQANAPALTPWTIIPTLQASDTNNLTDQLATAFVNGVILANPAGATRDSSGNPALISPDANAIAATVVSSTAIADLKTPDWNIEAASQPIKTATGNASSAIATYTNALNNIVNEDFIATNLMSIVNSQNPDPTQVSFVQSHIQKALSDSLALQTPAPLIAFQKSWVKMLVYQKNYLALLTDANTDPVKTALLLQNESVAYNAATQNFQNEMQNAQVNGISFGSAPKVAAGNPVVAFLNGVFGIKTAHAIFGVGDVISLVQFSWTEFANHLFDFAQSVALQILKNTLTALIQRKVLTWIQGSGAPRFITSWATTLTSAYTQSALSAIDDYMNNNCAIFPGFAPQLQLQLGIFYKPDNPVCSNLLQSSLGSYTFGQFYQNFQDGGWLAYGASMLPSGNYYGGLTFAAQAVDQAAVNGQNIVTVKAQANQGLNGDQVCSDGSNPNGTHVVCLNKSNQNEAPSHPNPDGTCDTGYVAVQEPNGGECANGTEPKVTTPGTFTNAVFGSAVDSTSKLVTAANNIVGILASVAGSLLNSLAQTAITAANNGVNSALNGGVSGISSGAIQSGGSASDIPAIALTCSPSSQTASTSVSVILGANGGANSADGTPPSYYWSSTTGASSTGPMYSESFPLPGTYYVTLTDSNDYASSTCQVIVQ